MNDLNDTIAAIATPIGEGGIGIIRISGRDAIETADNVFRTVSRVPVVGLPSQTAHYGFASDPSLGEVIDDGIITLYRAPRSYTGEDSAEIACHGGLVPMRRVLQAVLSSGARLAEPGEFTKRAFLNGRLDLAQAEAVLDIIRARTDEALRVARRQMDGALSLRVRMLREDMIAIMARIEASIDFPDDVNEPDKAWVTESITNAVLNTMELLKTADRGRIYREGIQAVIIGRPNVGKSSLLNALLRESRAIVTPIPGTTRDIIEEQINIRGIPVKTIDTAGVRDTDDMVEQMGVDRARKIADQADVVIIVIDAECDLASADKKIINEFSHKKMIIDLNKVDIIRDEDACEMAEEIKSWVDENIGNDICVIRTAIPENKGIAELEDAIADTVLTGEIPLCDGVIVSNIRHRQALQDARASLENALQTAEIGLPIDFISIDLKAAIGSLGFITGETVTEDIIDRIFSEFCIGK
ncbi:MAG: tRNA uridine-5-carboxymethylaminomethyl(34) synthesis GTPase MnmE [Armatimonadota bacterium]